MLLDHKEFILTIARSMIQEGLRTSTLNTPHVRTENLIQNDLTGEHFPEEIPRKEGTKRELSRPCFACNGSWSDMKNGILPKGAQEYGVPLVRKSYAQHLVSRFFIVTKITKIFCSVRDFRLW